jgi:novobiocin biosynthesis protein NovU/D-mycarose 3-C-methyltransferase
MACRICSNQTKEILNLGNTPPANSLLDSTSDIQENYPLVLEYCEKCHNLQLRDCLESYDLYKNYYYVTPDSVTLNSHYQYLYDYLLSKSYITPDSFVLEVGSNIGHFLSFIEKKVSKVLGIDPAENICLMAQKNGIETICDFFSKESAKQISNQYGKPNLVIARHCFAHNSDPHELMKGVTELLSSNAKVVIENAYALNTVENNEFDQIYHEHMFYYSIRSMSNLLEMHNLVLVDLLISLIHGGSIIFVAETKSDNNIVSESVKQYLSYEELSLNDDSLKLFCENAIKIKSQLQTLIKELKNSNKRIYTYGATAKGNTLLNFINVTSEEIEFCIDNTKIKQGKFLPKSNIKIISEEEGLNVPPDYFLLTAWNYKDEIIKKVRESGNYHSKFIIPFPSIHIV